MHTHRFRTVVLSLVMLFALLGQYTHMPDGGNTLLSHGWEVPAVHAADTIDIPLDIVLVQDETGSMGDDIGQLVNLTPQIWDSIAAMSSAQFRMSVVGFRDYAQGNWGENGDWVYRKLGDFTTDRQNFITQVNQLTAAGGYDTPESQLAALDYLLNTLHPCFDSNGNGTCTDWNDTPVNQQPVFRPGARRVILLATDADFQDPSSNLSYPGPTKEQVINQLIGNRALVIGLVPGGEGYVKDVDDLASATGGSTQNSGSSGQDVAMAILNALKQIKPVSADLSTIEVNPTTLTADGTSQAKIIVTIKDSEGNPVANKQVRLFSLRGAGDAIVQTETPTDANGQTFGWIASVESGSAVIWAEDMTDGVQLNQQATVTFTQQVMAPNERLTFCINNLANITNSEYENIGKLSERAADDASYFNSQIGEAKARVIFDVLTSAADLALPVAHNAAKNLPGALNSRVPGLIGKDWGLVAFLHKYYPLAGDTYDIPVLQGVAKSGFLSWPPRVMNTGLLYLAADLTNNKIEDVGTKKGAEAWGQVFHDNSWDQVSNIMVQDTERWRLSSEELRTAALNGVPVMNEAQQNLYADDLCYRALYPSVASGMISSQAETAHNLRSAYENTGMPEGLNWFIAKFLISQAANMLWGPVGKLAFDAPYAAIQYKVDKAKLDGAQRSMTLTQAFFNQAPLVIPQISSNAFIGVKQLQNKAPVVTAKATITGVEQISERNGLFSLFERNSYVLVHVRNTGVTQTTYVAYARYLYDTQLFFMPWATNVMVETGVKVLNPGEEGVIRIDFKQEAQGSSPKDRTTVGIDLLGINDTGNFKAAFYGFPWNPDKIGVSAANLGAANATLANAIELAAETPTIANPIDVYINFLGGNNNYEELLFIANPFEWAVQVNLTQQVPSGVTILFTDGTVSGQTITWQRTVYTKDVIKLKVDFQTETEPGKLITLPAVDMQIQNLDTGETLATISNAPQTEVPWPISVTPQLPLPKPTFMEGATLLLALKNSSDQNVTGNMTVNVLDAQGTSKITRQLNFKLIGSEQITLTVDLPGSLLPGAYGLEVKVKLGDVEKRMNYEIMQVEGALLYLPMLRR